MTRPLSPNRTTCIATSNPLGGSETFLRAHLERPHSKTVLLDTIQQLLSFPLWGVRRCSALTTPDASRSSRANWG